MIFIGVCFSIICCAQQTNSIHTFIKSLPKLECPVDTRQYDNLFEKLSVSDGNVVFLIDYKELKKHTVYKSESFRIDKLTNLFVYGADNYAFICPLGYFDCGDYKIILFVNDEYRNEDYVAITSVFYDNSGDFLFGDEESSKLECRMARYSEDVYYQFYNVFEGQDKIIHYGTGDEGDDKYIITLTEEGFNFEEIESQE